MAKILIVDDRPINREVLSMLLSENSYDVFEAEDGQQALISARQNKPDLIITDIAMPRFDGIFLVKELNCDPNLSAVPVIFYSASYKAAEAYRLASTSNVKYVLTKPCEPEIILGTIEGALDPNSTFFNNKHAYQAQDHYLDNKPVKKENRVKQKKERLVDQNLLLSNLIEISLDMSMEHDLDKLTYILCRGSRQFLSADYAGIILRAQNCLGKYHNVILNDKSVSISYELDEAELTEPLKEIFIYEKACCIHSPIIDIEKIGLNDIGLPLSSVLSLPLKTARDFYGKIYFINKSNPKLFTLSNQRYMMTLADKFSVNYENLLLYQAVERYTVQLENEMLERKKTEEKLGIYRNQMAEVMRTSSLGELASSLAHEINQPLAAIAAYVKGCIKRITNKKEITKEIIDILNETAFQAERAGEIIHRLKSFVRKGELFFEAVEINAFIREIINLFQQELQHNAVKIHYEEKKNLPNITIDKIQLQQVILNLLRNAFEAMTEAKTENPTINIMVSEMRSEMRSEIGSDRIMISIVDNGPGFPPHLENNLFELYFTTKAQGMGMGLAIARSIIEAHLGQIMAKLRPEGGSCFQIDLPIKGS